MRKLSLRESLKLDHDYTVASDKGGIQILTTNIYCALTIVSMSALSLLYVLNSLIPMTLQCMLSLLYSVYI